MARRSTSAWSSWVRSITFCSNDLADSANLYCEAWISRLIILKELVRTESSNTRGICKRLRSPKARRWLAWLNRVIGRTNRWLINIFKLIMNPTITTHSPKVIWFPDSMWVITSASGTTIKINQSNPFPRENGKTSIKCLVWFSWLWIICGYWMVLRSLTCFNTDRLASRIKGVSLCAAFKRSILPFTFRNTGSWVELETKSPDDRSTINICPVLLTGILLKKCCTWVNDKSIPLTPTNRLLGSYKGWLAAIKIVPGVNPL